MYEFKKTEDQELLLESLKEVYERNDLDAYFKECDEKHEFPQKAIDVMVDAGFATLGIPEQYGGTEVDILTQCMVVEQACALGFPNLCWMNFACEVDDMLAFGSPEQQAETMKNAMTGTKPFSLGFTEPNAGSDNSAMSTRAEHRDGKVYTSAKMPAASLRRSRRSLIPKEYSIPERWQTDAENTMLRKAGARR